MTDHRHRPARAAPSHIVGRGEGATELGCHPEGVERAPADEHAVDELRFTTPREVELCVEGRPGERAFEPVGMALDLLPDRIRPGGLSRLAIGDEHRQPLGLLHRQGAQEQAVDDGEDRRVRADAERQRQHDHHGEAAVPDERPERIPDIPTDLIQTGTVTRGSHTLLGLLDAAELEDRQAARLGGRQTVLHLVGRGHVDE